jgi:hypothetical protein
MTNLSMSRERGILLSGWLIYVVLANLWTAYRLIEAYIDWESHGSVSYVPGWAFLALAGLSLVNVLGAVLVWLWKRAGVYLVILVTAIALVINLFAFQTGASAFLGLIGAIVLGVLVSSKSSYSRINPRACKSKAHRYAPLPTFGTLTSALRQPSTQPVAERFPMLNVLRSEHFLAATHSIQFVRCKRIQPLPHRNECLTPVLILAQTYLV